MMKKICTNINPDKNLDGPMDLKNLEEKNQPTMQKSENFANVCE
jgi:hypothetical protein